MAVSRRRSVAMVIYPLLLLLFANNVCAREYRVGALLSLREPAGSNRLVPTGGEMRQHAVIAELAVRHFNARDASYVAAFGNISSCEHTLKLRVEDDGSTTAGAVEAILQKDGKPQHDVIVGPSTNAAALVAALVGGTSKVPVVSWNAGASALDDRSQYPFYARTNPSQRETARAIVDWMHLSGITFVAVFLNDNDGYELCAEMVIAGGRLGIDFIPVAGIASRADKESRYEVMLDSLVNLKARVIFCTVRDEDLDYLLEAAKARGLVSPYHSWLFSGKTSDEKLVSLPFLANGALKIASHGLDDVGGSSNWGRLNEDWPNLDVEDYNGIFPNDDHEVDITLGEGYFEGKLSNLAAYTFDAVATVGLAICSGGEISLGLDESTTREGLVDFMQRIRALDFEGMCGRVRFDEFANRVDPVFVVKNVRRGSLDTLGLWSTARSWHVPDDPGKKFMIAIGSDEHDDGEYVVSYPDGTARAPADKINLCDFGEFFDETSRSCSLCPFGREARVGEAAELITWSSVVTSCSACAVGYYRGSDDAKACAPCADRTVFQPRVGALQCEDCPANTERTILGPGLSVEECKCKSGYYSLLSESGNACEECPAGASCLGEEHPPVNKKGYWGNPRDPVKFWKCEELRCKANFQCRRGWQGRMCKTIIPRQYYTISRLGPYRCPAGNAAKVFVTLFELSVVVTIWIWLGSTLTSRPSLSIMTHFIQLVAILTRFNFKYFPSHQVMWPYRLFLEFFLFDIGIVSPSCLTKVTFVRSSVAQVLLVLLGLVVYLADIALFGVCAKLVKDPKYRSFAAFRASFGHYSGKFGVAFSKRIATILSFIDVQHTAITYNAFLLLRCDRYENGGLYMTAYPEIKCSSSARYASVRLLSFLCIFIFVLGIPHLIAANIYYEYAVNQGVHHSHAQARLGWVFASFRPPHHAWHLRRTYLRIALCFCATIVDNGFLALCLTLTVLIPAYSMHEHVQPYSDRQLNRLERLGFLALLNACIWGVMMGHQRAFWASFWYGLCVAVQIIFLGNVAWLAMIETDAANCKQEMHSTIRDWSRTMADGKKEAAVFAQQAEQRGSRRWPKAPPVWEAEEEGREDVGQMRELTKTFLEKALHLWMHEHDRSEDDMVVFARLAKDLNFIVSDDSFTSVYSRDNRSMFWRHISKTWHGVVDFVLLLNSQERHVVYGVLAKLQKHLDVPDLRDAQVMHNLILEEDRSSVLYYLFSCGDDQFADISTVLKGMADVTRQTDFLRAQRLVMRPAYLRAARGSDNQHALEQAARHKKMRDCWVGLMRPILHTPIDQAGKEEMSRLLAEIEDREVKAQTASSPRDNSGEETKEQPTYHRPHRPHQPQTGHKPRRGHASPPHRPPSTTPAGRRRRSIKANDAVGGSCLYDPCVDIFPPSHPFSSSLPPLTDSA